MTRSFTLSAAPVWSSGAMVRVLRRRRSAAVAVALAVAVGVVVAPIVLHAERRQLDAEKSTLTVYVYKSGLFSALADDHVIDATLAVGTIDEGSPSSVSIDVRAADLRVRDPKLSAGKRAEVQARMVGPEVLDVEKYPSIAFESTAIEPKGADSWTVAGRLTIHGQTRDVTFATARSHGRYRGSVTVKQRDFGITPISIAGGTVKVKDEVKIEFDVVAR
jgi:polyisoprenoid-binding protein YceI